MLGPVGKPRELTPLRLQQSVTVIPQPVTRERAGASWESSAVGIVGNVVWRLRPPRHFCNGCFVEGGVTQKLLVSASGAPRKEYFKFVCISWMGKTLRKCNFYSLGYFKFPKTFSPQDPAT
nr:PREDICTED: uncharacterized protein LOC103565038 [Equus przewalskii]